MADGADPQPPYARLKVRTGDENTRADYLPENGELLWDSNKNLYVGDGETQGGVPVGTDASRMNEGTLPDTRLSSNVARRDQANTFAATLRVAGGLSYKFTDVTANYTLSTSDVMVGLNLYPANHTISLPNLSTIAIGHSFLFVLNNTGSNTASLQAYSGQNISFESFGSTYAYTSAKTYYSFLLIAINPSYWKIIPGGTF